MSGDSRNPNPLGIFELSRLYRRRSAVGGGNDGDDGFSRVVYCNDPASPEALELRYPDNRISTTKYTVVNFVPKSLFEQFRRVANMFFLVVAVVSFTKLAPYRAVSVALPLVFVVVATMVKEGIEDWQRKKQDIEVNNRKVQVYDGAHSFYQTEWKNLRVGDVVKVEKDEFFPADLFLLSSNFDDGVCYVETMNLDGETNLKRKQSLEVTTKYQSEDSLAEFKSIIKCENPNEKLYSFVGTLDYEHLQYPLSPNQILLRDSKLRNTHHVYGVVVFTGHDTKVMQNAMNPPSKRSKIERKMDKIIYLLFAILVVISSIGSVYFGIKTKSQLRNGNYTWYLRPDNTTIFFDPNRATIAAFCHFLTVLMLYGSLIPISLYISIEIVKVLQSTFIDQDLEMYCEESDKPARARTSNLNEELGLVDTVLSDKTGTLTCNSMEFVKCSIGGTSYGRGSSEAEISSERGLEDVSREFDDIPSASALYSDNGISQKSVKGFNFSDDRLMNGEWAKEPHSDIIQKFFRVLAICHTAIPVATTDSERMFYEAESPDETAFVAAAQELGFEFYKRTQTSLSVHEFDPVIGRKVSRTYELLNVLEFSSARKRMSVIVRTEENQLLLLCKGADSIILERLAKCDPNLVKNTKSHINNYSEAGLRTLAIAYRELSAEEYIAWNDDFVMAKSSVSANRDEIVDEVSERIERELTLLGATAVEDKLQKGVPECIKKLAQAGIKIWVLTGDKLETAINIGFACQLLRKGMEQIVITLDSPDIQALKNDGDKALIAKTLHENIAKQIQEAQLRVSKMRGSAVLFALIIDGDSLTFALSNSLANLFLDLAVDCVSVICCRTSPKQKALVTRLVKSRTRRTTLAIGDGGNDVGMLQEADIGVGISGVEGMQAVMASDFAIAQFRFLERLLLVHGHWCYRRISAMICYFFYKNITFGFTLFWFEAHAYFSAQPAYNDWFISVYSVAFTSLPVIALGVFDKDMSSRLCIKYPMLHQDGILNIFFSWHRILGWMFNGVCSSIIIYYFTSKAILSQAIRQDGKVAGSEILGLTMYSCVVWAVNCQLAIYISYFTWIQHLAIWGSILFWYIFLVVYGFFPPSFSTSAYHVFLETCFSSPLYWLAIFLVVISALLPYFCFSTFQKTFFPTYHDLIQRQQLKRQQ